MTERRMPKFLSPSALALWKANPQEYYGRYICPLKIPAPPQTQPMAAGSAFDAFIKSYLHENIYGKNHPEADKYSIEAMLESQVEIHNREWARKNGRIIFEKYSKSGALADLMLELNSAVEEPRFEFTVSGIVGGSREGVSGAKHGVPLLGKPDLRFINSQGAHVIFDFKVNGYCGKYNTSPQAGYVSLIEETGIGNWKRCAGHKDAYVTRYLGMEINTGSYLNDYAEDWATQLATYSWLLGEEVGAESIIGIDQLVTNGSKRDAEGIPLMRIARHRSRISQKFQIEAMHSYQTLWAILNEQPFYFFKDKSFEESALMCQTLDAQAKAMGGIVEDSVEAWIYQQGRNDAW